MHARGRRNQFPTTRGLPPASADHSSDRPIPTHDDTTPRTPSRLFTSQQSLINPSLVSRAQATFQLPPSDFQAPSQSQVVDRLKLLHGAAATASSRSASEGARIRFRNLRARPWPFRFRCRPRQADPSTLHPHAVRPEDSGPYDGKKGPSQKHSTTSHKSREY